MSGHRAGPSDRGQAGGRRPRVERRARSFTPRLGWLEDRTMLSGVAAGSSTPDLAAEAAPLALDTPLVEEIAPLATTYYRVSSDVGGKLAVTLRASGFAARV